jgi:hypothetical protein
MTDSNIALRRAAGSFVGRDRRARPGGAGRRATLAAALALLTVPIAGAIESGWSTDPVGRTPQQLAQLAAFHGGALALSIVASVVMLTSTGVPEGRRRSGWPLPLAALCA